MSLLEHEEVLVHRGERSDVQLVIAVHSTALGPSLGGARLWRYGALGDAIADALRLSEGMTYKAAAAGLELGGGKAVLCAPPDRALPHEARRELMLLDLGDAVESLDGRYITAEDVGTGTADMATVGERTPHVWAGRPRRVAQGTRARSQHAGSRRRSAPVASNATELETSAAGW